MSGTVLLATAPAGPDRPAVRRAQALAAGHETGLAIMREILRCKLAGQARVARLLGGEEAAALIELAVVVAFVSALFWFQAQTSTRRGPRWAPWEDLHRTCFS
jgi:hypothetical protein